MFCAAPMGLGMAMGIATITGMLPLMGWKMRSAKAISMLVGGLAAALIGLEIARLRSICYWLTLCRLFLHRCTHAACFVAALAGKDRKAAAGNKG